MSMNKDKRIREKFLNYLDGDLSEGEKAEFKAILLENQHLKNELELYRQVVQMEKVIQTEDHKLDERFVSKVMAKIKHPEPNFFRRLIMNFNHPFKSKMLAIGGSALVIVLGISIFYQAEYQGVLHTQTDNQAQVAPSVKEEVTKQLEKEKSKETKPIDETDSEIQFNDIKITKGDPRLLKELPQSDDSRNEKQAEAKSEQAKIVNEEVDGSLINNIEQEAVLGRGQALKSAPVIMPSEQEVHAGGAISQNYAPMIAIQPPAQLFQEKYYQAAENKPILTSVEPMSTFSIDVDTGSYTNARRFLKNGTLPPAESIRIEEFLNYFDYNYPVSGDRPFSSSLEVAPSPYNDGKYLLKVAIQSKNKTADRVIKPWNLVFLVDVSGSMESKEKLPLVKSSLKLLADKMRENDTIAIVTYAGGVGVALESGQAKDKAKIISVIDSLSAAGGTYGSGGIIEAYKVAEKSFIKDGINRVILATDGDFNVGISNHEELVKLIEEKRRSGVTLTTLGFGEGNYNEAIMEQLANKGNGNYFYIDSFQEARKVFETDLYGTVEVVAKDVKLQMEFNPEHVVQYRLVGYENRKLDNQDFNNDKIDAGEIGLGHRVTALYELVLANTPLAKKLNLEYRYKQDQENKPQAKSNNLSQELGFLKIRYKEPEGTDSKLLSFPIEKSRVLNNVNETSVDFRFASAVSAFAHKLRQSPYSPDFDFSDILKLAEDNLGDDKLGYRREFVELVKNAKAISK